MALASASRGGGRGSVSWLLQVQVQPALPGGTATKGPEHLSLKESRELVQVIRNKHRAIKKDDELYCSCLVTRRANTLQFLNVNTKSDETSHQQTFTSKAQLEFCCRGSDGADGIKK